MKRLVVLGAGTAGTIVVNKLRSRLPESEWQITVVDQSDSHHYQPGYLLLPFGVYAPEQLTKPSRDFIPKGVALVLAGIDRVVAEDNLVVLDDGRELPYDYLVIATGTSPRPDQTPGMTDPAVWRQDRPRVLHPRRVDPPRRGAQGLAGWPPRRAHHGDADQVPGGAPGVRLPRGGVLHRQGHARPRRDRLRHPARGGVHQAGRVPAPGHMLEERKIVLEPDFVVDRIDPDGPMLVSMDEREVPFDLLVTIPLQHGRRLHRAQRPR